MLSAKFADNQIVLYRD
jgi:hypothetical protein